MLSAPVRYLFSHLLLVPILATLAWGAPPPPWMKGVEVSPLDTIDPVAQQYEVWDPSAPLPTELDSPETVAYLARLEKAGAPGGGPRELELFTEALKRGWRLLPDETKEALRSNPPSGVDGSWLSLFAQAFLIKEQAWEIRGSGFSNTVNAAATQEFQSLLLRALKLLRRVDQVSPGNLPALVERLDIYRALGQRDLLKAEFKRAQSLQSGHYLSLFAALTASFQKWGGSPGQGLALARRAVQRWPDRPLLLDLLIDAHLERCEEKINYHRDRVLAEQHDDCLAEPEVQADFQWALERLAAADPVKTYGLDHVFNAMKVHLGKGGKTMEEWTKLYGKLEIPAAKLRLAKLMASRGGAKDLEEACGMFLVAHRAGLQEGTFLTAACLERDDVALDLATPAAELYRGLAEAGHPAAAARYGSLLARGLGVTRDRAAAAEWLALSYRQTSSPDTGFELGLVLVSGDRSQRARALRVFEVLGKDRNHRASAAMAARLWETGAAGEASPERAKEWSERAGKDYVEALGSVAVYRSQYGSPEMTLGQNALPLLKKAANLGAAEAAIQLATLYTGVLRFFRPSPNLRAVPKEPSTFGRYGVPPDWPQVLKWASRGLLLLPLAQDRSGPTGLATFAIERRRGGDWPAPEDQLHWLEKIRRRAAPELRRNIAKNLAVAYHLGRYGFPRSRKDSETWLQQAIEDGDAENLLLDDLLGQERASSGGVTRADYRPAPVKGYEHLGVPVWQLPSGKFRLGDSLYVNDLATIHPMILAEAKNRVRGGELMRDLDAVRRSGSAEDLALAAAALQAGHHQEGPSELHRVTGSYEESEEDARTMAKLAERREVIDDLRYRSCEAGNKVECERMIGTFGQRGAIPFERLMQKRRHLWLGALAGSDRCMSMLGTSYGKDPRFDDLPDSQTDPSMELFRLWHRAAYARNPRGLSKVIVKRFHLRQEDPFPNGIPPVPEDLSVAGWEAAGLPTGVQFPWTTFGLAALALSLILACVRRLR